MRKRLTYANVMSTVCLFVVLGGTATAASKLLTGKQIKNGSITGVDVKNDSLLSSDVRNGSLLATDFKAGQLPSGAQGQAGPQGPAGPAGPSDAYNNGLSPGGPGLQLEAGGWDVRAILRGDNSASGAAAELNCTLTISSSADTAGPGRDIEVTTVPANGKVTLPLEQIHTLGGPGTANVDCTGPYKNGLIFAVRVGTVHEI